MNKYGFWEHLLVLCSSCCVNASYTYCNIYSFFCQSSCNFSFFLPLSRLFHSLPLASIYIIFATSVPKKVPDCSRFYDVLPTYYIRFENVHCSYINLIDSKYSISSLKAFGSSCCHNSQNFAFFWNKQCNVDYNQIIVILVRCSAKKILESKGNWNVVDSKHVKLLL